MKKYTVRDNEVIYYSKKKGFFNIPKTQHNYKDIIDYLMNPDFNEETFIEMINQKELDIQEISKGKIIKQDDGTAKIGEINIPNDMLHKIQELQGKGYGWEHYKKFWKRCLANPSPKSVELLFEYLVLHRFTITEDGCFLAYKGVSKDFKDVYTGTFDNSVGNIVKMERSQVVYDPSQTCSVGLHCGELQYARNWGPVVVLVKVDPANVVSVPKHSNGAKIRVCEYKVESVYENEQPIETSVVNKNNQPIQVNNNRKSKWTTEEENILKELISINPKFNWNAVSEKLCRSKESCRKKWSQLKKFVPVKTEEKVETKLDKDWIPLKSKTEVENSKKTSRKWTPKEELKLKNLVVVSRMEWNDIAKEIGRSVGACIKKYYKLLKSCPTLRKRER